MLGRGGDFDARHATWLVTFKPEHDHLDPVDRELFQQGIHADGALAVGVVVEDLVTTKRSLPYDRPSSGNSADVYDPHPSAFPALPAAISQRKLISSPPRCSSPAHTKSKHVGARPHFGSPTSLPFSVILSDGRTSGLSHQVEPAEPWRWSLYDTLKLHLDAEQATLAVENVFTHAKTTLDIKHGEVGTFRPVVSVPVGGRAGTTVRLEFKSPDYEL